MYSRGERVCFTSIGYHSFDEWYTNPDRPCKGDDRYGDLTLTVGRGSGKIRAELRRRCLEDCPVLAECRQDLLASSGDWKHYGIQAGIQGAT